MYIIHAICIRFGESVQIFKLSDYDQERPLIDRPDKLKKIVNSRSIRYLYLYLRLLMMIEKIAGLSINPYIRSYGNKFNKLESIDAEFIKLLHVFSFIKNDLKKAMTKYAISIVRKYMLN